jgi:hypothetical protein
VITGAAAGAIATMTAGVTSTAGATTAAAEPRPLGRGLERCALKIGRPAADLGTVSDHAAAVEAQESDPFVGRLLATEGADPAVPRDALAIRDLVVEIVSGNHFTHFAAAFALGSRCRSTLENDLGFEYALGFAAWVDRRTDQAIAHALRVVALAKHQAAGYRLLGMAHLTAGRPTEAYLALSAGLASCPRPESLTSFRVLAENLMEGRAQVELTVDGVRYRFALSCFNGQAMEAAVIHSGGSLTELTELRFLRDTLGKTPVVLEVGTMVGNHTVFFLKNLAPARLIAFDADVRSIGQTQLNCLLNDGDDIHTELVLHHKAVGERSGRINLIGVEVELTTLDAEIHEHVDFLKVDVDGMELGLLEGARALIARSRPRMLIEVSPANMRGFEAFLREVGYVVERRFERDVDTNCFAVPAPA